MINNLRYIALPLFFCFLSSQDSFNANLVGHWFAPNENYWSENISDFNDIWGYENEDGVRYALMGGWDGTYIVDGKFTIRDLNRQLDWNLPDEEAATVAGLILHESRRIPEVGQTFLFYGVRFEVLRRQRNQIISVRVLRQER